MSNIRTAQLNSADVPAPGALIEIAAGIFWARFKLPFALNHVNVYLVEDNGGWAVVDTGIGDGATKEAWCALLTGPLRKQRLTRLIITHHHPDHMGLAGWLAEEFAIPVYMTESEYLFAQHLRLNSQFVDEEGYRSFYERHGMTARDAAMVISRGHSYKKMITGLPWSYRQLCPGDTISIGGRRFEILTGGGHSPDQAMLFCREEGVFLAADQVLSRISPNISVLAIAPEADPLGQYLHSLGRIKEVVPDGVLVLPGHDLPFKKLHDRIDELARHHELRCEMVESICKSEPKTAAEILPLLFRRPLDPHQMSFAFSETLAHMNMMSRNGRLSWVPESNVLRVLAP